MPLDLSLHRDYGNPDELTHYRQTRNAGTVKKQTDPFICKHGNDIELCEVKCNNCLDNAQHKCSWHGKGSCGLCPCEKFVDKKKAKSK